MGLIAQPAPPRSVLRLYVAMLPVLAFDARPVIPVFDVVQVELEAIPRHDQRRRLLMVWGADLW
jgi:hypothetical protein